MREKIYLKYKTKHTNGKNTYQYSKNISKTRVFFVCPKFSFILACINVKQIIYI